MKADTAIRRTLTGGAGSSNDGAGGGFIPAFTAASYVPHLVQQSSGYDDSTPGKISLSGVVDGNSLIGIFFSGTSPVITDSSGDTWHVLARCFSTTLGTAPIWLAINYSASPGTHNVTISTGSNGHICFLQEWTPIPTGINVKYSNVAGGGSLTGAVGGPYTAHTPGTVEFIAIAYVDPTDITDGGAVTLTGVASILSGTYSGGSPNLTAYIGSTISLATPAVIGASQPGNGVGGLAAFSLYPTGGWPT